MATRRLAVSRAGGSMAPPTARRPASAMSNAKSSSSSTPALDAGDSMPALRKLGPGSKEAGETNIKVVVRCRGRSAREAESDDIFTPIGAQANELTIETAPATSKLGVVTPAVTRTYPFDLVFGPEADQCLVYEQVVAPMLQEVLQGYNCTLFAYGQTGSGKTYTMQGDVAPTAMGNPSEYAGMIPRVLFKLFEHLDTLPDYAVKVSYVELYNEELRDLLGPEPTKETPRAELKIFDDAAKKGTVIQGLEEVGVRSIGEALAVLARGSQRRQSAATHMNEHSSRSHSVFTLSVHTRDGGGAPAGEDVLRAGKMHLVDLAGSENIGRSGAADKRAREAGMINQSLLTLGRVINALVDGAAHVPYRESKLTRLLQDSLGGRTKTCIVAAVSPARTNTEETLSTLEYALRAKSIRNRPELNQRMTRGALLKEYVAEIERLKADVLAAREKNGIFVSEVRWGALEAEQEDARRGALDAKKQIEVAESRLRNLQEEFKQSLALLGRKDTELAAAQDTLATTEAALGTTASQLRSTERALEEEAAVRRATEQTEALLDEIARALRETLEQSLGDNAGLFDKLERKAGVLTANAHSVRAHGQALARDVKTLAAQLDGFAGVAGEHAQEAQDEVERLRRAELNALAALDNQVGEQAHRTQEALSVVQAKEAIADEAMRSIEAVVTTALDHLKQGFATWAEQMRQTSQAKCQALQDSSQKSFANIEQAMKSVSTSAESVLRETTSYVETERALAADARTAVTDAVTAELAHLRAQNAQLTRLLEAERVEGARDREALLQAVAGAVGEYAAARDRRVRAAVAGAERAGGAAEAALGAAGARHRDMMDDALERGERIGAVLDKKSTELKRTRDGAVKALTAYGAVVNDGVAGMQSHVMASTSTYEQELQTQADRQRMSYDEARDQLSRAKRARHDAVQQVDADSKAFAKSAQQSIASSSKLVSASTSKLASTTTDWHEVTSTYAAGASTQLSSARAAAQALLADGTREDVPTGATPQKRRWEYADSWARTKGRDALLREHHAGELGSGLRTELAPAAEDAPAEAGAEEVEPEGVELNSPASDVPPPPPYEDVPSAKPAHSRTSSTASAVPTTRAAPAKRALALPKAVAGTLTERPANMLAGRRRLR